MQDIVVIFKEIAKSARWSNEKTFAKIYDKPIQEDFSNYLFRRNLLFLICICIYAVVYTGNIYCVNYSQSNTNRIEENPGLKIISSLILSNLHFYERTVN